MEDDFGLELAHHFFDADSIRDVADHRVQPELVVRVLELDRSHAGCSHGARTSQAGRLEPGDLAAKLGSDRTAGASHHDAPPSDEVSERGLIEPDWCAGEQIFDRGFQIAEA
jgi:hypothetical protein